MKYFSLPIIFLLFCLPAGAQKAPSKRVISYVELSDPLNQPLQRPGSDVAEILFDGARKGLVPLYHFDSFKKPPALFSWKQLDDKLKKLDQRRFRPWKKDKEYQVGAVVSDGGYRYRSLSEKNTLSPAEDYYSGTWEYFQPTHRIMGLDYQEDSEGGRLLNYVHFYTDDFTYEASFNGADAISFLNTSGMLWYRIEDHFMDHLAGDIFLFDYYGQKKVYDVFPYLDTAKLQLSKEANNGTGTFVGVRTVYMNGTISQFILTKEEHYGDESVKLDTLPISLLRKSLDKDSTEFFLMGDALLKPGCLHVSSVHPTVELDRLTTNGQQTKILPVDTITCMVSERFGLNDQGSNPVALERNAGDLVNLIYAGIAEKRIDVYSSDSLSGVYTPGELVKQWTTEPVPGVWDPATAYHPEDEVFYDGAVYVATENDDSRTPPPKKQKKWTVKLENEEIVQPDDIQQLDFGYQITFTNSGKLVSKEAVSIGLRCAHDFSYRTLGFVSAAGLKEFILMRDAGLLKRIAGWFEGREGVYQVLNTSPLKYYRK
ncbi:MAG TPA: hypothetical protein VK517_05460 [Cyclobacteriaceae bacterium]|nr:hypothetical protein [Cyclobacteriaceae bacterium]